MSSPATKSSRTRTDTRRFIRNAVRQQANMEHFKFMEAEAKRRKEEENNKELKAHVRVKNMAAKAKRSIGDKMGGIFRRKMG